MITTRAAAAELDTGDPLAGLRDAFLLPEGLIYLDGNSLGALPKSTPDRLATAIRHEWGERLIRSWNEAGWWTASQRVAGSLAPLLGASADEIAVADSTSVNLFKLLVAGLRMRPDRPVLVVERHAFPTDVYIASSVAELIGNQTIARGPENQDRRTARGFESQYSRTARGFESQHSRTARGFENQHSRTARGFENRQGIPGGFENRQLLRLIEGPADLPAALDDQVGVVCLSHVDFRTGAMWPAAETTAAVHDAGALMLWDLCHSAGALDVDLRAWRADLAVGCGYKYLNGGPGAPAYAFVATEHHSALRTPLPGWHGHADPFAMSDDYRPAAGIGQLANGTPPMLSLLAFEEAVGVLAGVSTADLRAKAKALTSLFVDLVTQMCPELSVLSPHDADQRGAQVSLGFEHAFALVQALIERNVIGDFRSPDIARFGFAPAYVKYVDVWDAVEVITDVLGNGEYLADRYANRPAVT